MVRTRALLLPPSFSLSLSLVRQDAPKVVRNAAPPRMSLLRQRRSTEDHLDVLVGNVWERELTSRESTIGGR
jgi:hypothetical protein